MTIDPPRPDLAAVLSGKGTRVVDLPRWAGWFLIILTGSLVVYWSWGTWADLIIDFGRELYVAWRLSEGDVLYRDIAYFNGPFSPYLNALWFALFGVGFRTLVICNLGLLALFTVLIFRMIEDISDQMTATVACLVFLGIFSFLQLIGVGNFNFVAPYSHEATHGTMLAFLSLYWLWLYDRKGSTGFLAGAGFTLGLVALTKIELFVGALIADSAFLLMLAIDRRLSWLQGIWAPALFFVMAMLPALIAVSVLNSVLPVTNLWTGFLNRELTSMSFYQRGMGLAQPVENIIAMARWTALYVAIFGPAIWIGLTSRVNHVRRLVLAIGWAVLVLAAIVMSVGQIQWSLAFRPLPLLMVLSIGVLGVTWINPGQAPEERRATARLLSLFLLAFVFLWKMLFAARIYQYGFFLAMPATLLLVVIVLFWLPRNLEVRGGSGFPLRLTAAAVLLSTVALHLAFAGTYFERKQYSMGTGADEFRADFRANAVLKILDSIGTHVAPGETLSVLPEGVMLNYLARRSTSIPYISLMPLETIMFGEEEILRSFQDHPPDFIALVHRDTSKFGYPFFGTDYGSNIMTWVRSNYRIIEQAGETPFQSDGFGIQLLARK
jgi:hypothetical protein